MTPAIICSGFKKSGVHPFNPITIDCGVMLSSMIDDHGNNSSGCDKESGMDGDDDDGGSAINGDEGDNLEMAQDKVLLFQQRHEEGYDLYDPEQDGLKFTTLMMFHMIVITL